MPVGCRMRARSRRRWPIVAVLCMAASGSVRADDRPAAAPSDATSSDATSSDTAASDETRLEELVVEGERPVSAASSREMRAHDFEVRPHFNLLQVLNNVPGLLVAQHQGGAKAAQYFLRGFD